MAWETKKIGEVCEIINDKPEEFSGKKKYYTTKSINNSGDYNPILVDFKNRPGRANLYPILDDVGFAVMKNTNKVFMINEELIGGIFSTGFRILRTNNKILPKFLFIYLESDFFQKKKDELSGEGIMGGIKKLDTSNISIPVPPLSVQKQIVDILDKAFEKISKAKENTEKNLKNSKEVFESYLQKVLENKGEDWEEKKLGEVCDGLFAGGDVPKNNFSKVKNKIYTIPIFSNGEKNKGLYGYTDKARVTKSSITISARGTIGYSAIREESFFPVVRLIVATPNTKIINLFFLKYVIKNISFIKSGTSIPQLTVPMIKEYNILFPKSLEEQKQIVSKLDLLSQQTKQLESVYTKKLTDLEELKQSILQKAFSGGLVEVLA